MKVYVVMYQSKHGDDTIVPFVAYLTKKGAKDSVQEFNKNRNIDGFWYPEILELEVVE